MAANVAVAQDPAGNLKPAKDKSTERIDGIVALIMAIGRAIVAQEEQHLSYRMLWVSKEEGARRPERRDSDRLVWTLDAHGRRERLRTQVGLFRRSRTNPAMATTTPIAKRIQ
jgi:Phage Terminase